MDRLQFDSFENYIKLGLDNFQENRLLSTKPFFFHQNVQIMQA